jgi:hypothetical protein
MGVLLSPHIIQGKNPSLLNRLFFALGYWSRPEVVLGLADFDGMCTKPQMHRLEKQQRFLLRCCGDHCQLSADKCKVLDERDKLREPEQAFAFFGAI